MPTPPQNTKSLARRARLDALERRHTGPPPRENWLEARIGGPSTLAGLRASARRADAGRAAEYYRLAIARLRGGLRAACRRDVRQWARLARLCNALGTARTQALADPCAHPCN